MVFEKNTYNYSTAEQISQDSVTDKIKEIHTSTSNKLSSLKNEVIISTINKNPKLQVNILYKDSNLRVRNSNENVIDRLSQGTEIQFNNKIKFITYN